MGERGEEGKGREGNGRTNLQLVFAIQACHPDDAFAVASSFRPRRMWREGIVVPQISATIILPGK